MRRLREQEKEEKERRRERAERGEALHGGSGGSSGDELRDEDEPVRKQRVRKVRSRGPQSSSDSEPDAELEREVRPSWWGLGAPRGNRERGVTKEISP